LALLAACGSSGTTPPATKAEPSTSCVKVRKLDTRVGEPTAFGITAAFMITDCGTGKGVSGLTTTSFTIEEDGKAVDAIESASVILSRTAEPYLTVVLDNTPTVRQSGATDAIADGAIALVDNLSKAAPNARVAVHWFDIKADVKQDFTNDFAKAKSAIEAYKTASAGTPSTNLYGSIVAAVGLSKQAQQARKDNQKNGVLTYGNIVVFTDGADNAAINTLQDAQEAIADTNDEVQMVGFKHSDELDPETFKKLGNAPAVVVTSIEKLKSAFAAKADQIASLANGTYVLGYCTPKAAGTHTVTIRLPGKGASDPVPFDATPFQTQGGPACGVDKFQKACDGLMCGGLWCGGCFDTCNAQNVCECTGGKGGAKCDICLNSHKEFPSCDKCLPLYTGADCDQCADASKGGDLCDGCANFGFALPGCKACKPEFTGANCDQCSNLNTALPTCTTCQPEFKGAACDECANEHAALPNCKTCQPSFAGDQCTECASPNAVYPNCAQCKPGFTGIACDQCSNPNMALPGCTACKPAFTGPNCSQCVNANAVGPDCQACKPGFTGIKCDECANPNMALPACNSCKPGFAGDKCDQCANANMAYPGCDKCKPEFAGENCDECSNPNTELPDCKACKPAFAGANCDACANPNMALPACSSCKPEFKGAACNECVNNLKIAPKCEKCSPGFSGPDCATCSPAGNAGAKCDLVWLVLDFQGGEGADYKHTWGVVSKLTGKPVASGNGKVGKWSQTVEVSPGDYEVWLKDSATMDPKMSISISTCGDLAATLQKYCGNYSGYCSTLVKVSLCKQPCKTAWDCADGGFCLGKSCGAQCEYYPANDGAACGSGMACLGGVCKAGATCDPTKCNDANACTTDSCDASGKCANKPAADGLACGSGLACKSGTCVSTGGGGGGCTPSSCNDSNPCTTDTCGSSGKCSYANVTDGTNCGNGLACKAGACVSTGGGGSGHFCDTHCGEQGKGCYCDADCKKFSDCCDPTGTKKAGPVCTGSTCAACK